MNKTAVLFLTIILLWPAVHAFAQTQPTFDLDTKSEEGYRGQPVNGLALRPTPEFQAAQVNPELPGQPGYPPPILPPAGYQMPPLSPRSASVQSTVQPGLQLSDP